MDLRASNAAFFVAKYHTYWSSIQPPMTSHSSLHSYVPLRRASPSGYRRIQHAVYSSRLPTTVTGTYNGCSAPKPSVNANEPNAW